MNFLQLLQILKTRRRIVLFTMMVTLLTTVAVSLILPKTYKSTATLVLNFKGTDPVNGATLPAQLVPGYMDTQVDIINSKSVALKVVDALKLVDDPEYKKLFNKATEGKGSLRDWIAEGLLKTIEAVPLRESSVLNISVKGRDPIFTAAMTNAFAAAYQETNLELKLNPLKKASTYFHDQIKSLRENVDAAQQRLTRYQQEQGIVSSDSRLDVENARLNELSTQLVEVQGLLMESQSRVQDAKRSSVDESAEVVTSPLIQNIKSELMRTEGRLAYLATKVTAEHPGYQAAEAEVRKLRSTLNANMHVAQKSTENNERILKLREAEIRNAVEIQKAKLLNLNRARDRLAILAKEVESTQRAYDNATQRFAQLNLEGQANLSDIAVLTRADPPFKPSSPRMTLNMLLAIVLGTILGAVFGLVAELFDRRVRSINEMAEALQAPVLGSVKWDAIKSRRLGLPTLFLPQH
jgi:polysaccharide biosynthesis transport protein